MDHIIYKDYIANRRSFIYRSLATWTDEVFTFMVRAIIHGAHLFTVVWPRGQMECSRSWLGRSFNGQMKCSRSWLGRSFTVLIYLP